MDGMFCCMLYFLASFLSFFFFSYLGSLASTRYYLTLIVLLRYLSSLFFLVIVQTKRRDGWNMSGPTQLPFPSTLCTTPHIPAYFYSSISILAEIKNPKKHKKERSGEKILENERNMRMKGTEEYSHDHNCTQQMHSKGINNDSNDDHLVCVGEKREERDGVPADTAGAVYTWLNPMVVELKQLLSLTSATSSGSANVMSTHYSLFVHQSRRHLHTMPSPSAQG